VTFTRNIIGTILVFALTPWVAAVGISNVIITITVLGTVVLAFVLLFIWKGKRMRVWTTGRYRYYAERQFENAGFVSVVGRQEKGSGWEEKGKMRRIGIGMRGKGEGKENDSVRLGHSKY
jgi:hypothetical protein